MGVCLHLSKLHSSDIEILMQNLFLASTDVPAPVIRGMPRAWDVSLKMCKVLFLVCTVS